ncbi:MAG: DUF5615 family PIN-like protein [Chloroflexi bacterium]|nr:DUF5615 family PIN-like protein [Chloroflexota bacterium]
MAEHIRFHLDENVDSDIARALRRHGIDVTTIVDAGLRTLSDADQLAFAREYHRVLVTHDSDFLRMANFTSDHAGIVYCVKISRSIGEIVSSLILIYEVLVPEEMAGQVEYL